MLYRNNFDKKVNQIFVLLEFSFEKQYQIHG